MSNGTGKKKAEENFHLQKTESAYQHMKADRKDCDIQCISFDLQQALTPPHLGTTLVL